MCADRDRGSRTLGSESQNRLMFSKSGTAFTAAVGRGLIHNSTCGARHGFSSSLKKVGQTPLNHAAPLRLMSSHLGGNLDELPVQEEQVSDLSILQALLNCEHELRQVFNTERRFDPFPMKTAGEQPQHQESDVQERHFPTTAGSDFLNSFHAVQGLQGKESVRNEAFAFPDDKHESLEGKDNKERKTWIEEGAEESVMQTELLDNYDFNLTTMIKLVLKEHLQQSQDITTQTIIEGLAARGMPSQELTSERKRIKTIGYKHN